MERRLKNALTILSLISILGACDSVRTAVVVGSKAFTEGYLLGEMVAQKLEADGEVVSRRLGMGATGILYQALVSGEIDLYPEYTGTIAEAILNRPDLKSFNEIQNALAAKGLVMSQPLGFSNTYALAVTREAAAKHGLKTLSDLAKAAPALKAGFSHEFINRADGFKPLSRAYGIAFGGPTHSMQHTLAYEAIANRVVDVIDVYTTDAKIDSLRLVVLEDDKNFFPKYEAVILASRSFVEDNWAIWEKLNALSGTLSEARMRALNAAVDLERRPFAHVISLNRGQDASTLTPDRPFNRIFRRTKEHLLLVTVAVGVAVIAGIPLGVLATRSAALGQVILLISGLVQTIPSLALLCFLIPLFGIGTYPALVSLCLYGLLPVVLNTFSGIRAIDPKLAEMSRALGIDSRRRLTRLELPLASRSIMAGIKTSAIITIGTATLAALIGAGGYGAPILSGLATNNMGLILTGAIPAAVMALLAHGLFELSERLIVPKGLRKHP